MKSYERYLERIWLDHLYEWPNRLMHPLENMPDYDLWRANGGHNSGRKMPILFAGMLLDHDGMKHVRASFAEDEQTYYGQGYRGQKALWTIDREGDRRHEHLPPAQWDGPPFRGDNNGWKSEAAGGTVDQKTLRPADYDPFSGAGEFVQAMWQAYRPGADQIGAPAPRETLWLKLENYFQPPDEYAGKWGQYRSPLVERPEVKRLESVDRDGYRQHHVHVQISPEGALIDGYLLVPAGRGPFPAVLVPFYEPLTSIGQGTKGRDTHDYGLQLVRRGFVTLSIGTPGSLEKIGLDTRRLLVEAGAQGRRQPLTLLAYAAANCHTALAQMAEVDPARIGIIGLSYGGKWAMFASCLYEKFACAVWSDPGIVFDETRPNVNFWEPWYLGYDPKTDRKPGVPSAANPRTGLYKEMVEAGEDLVDLHALMAPRPVLVSGGSEDPPQRWLALNHLVAVNDALGYKSRVAMTSRPTHVPTAEALQLELAFLEYWLLPKSTERAAGLPAAQ